MNTTPKTPLVLLADAADELHKLAEKLTDAAEELLPDPQPAANANCPTCSLSFRETVGMVCQTRGTDYAPESTPAQPDEVGWVRMPFEVDICGDIIPADDLIPYARRLRTNLSEAERSLKDLATTKVALRPPQPAPLVLPTVEEVARAILAAQVTGEGWHMAGARGALDLIAARVPVWVPVKAGTVIKAGTRVRVEGYDWAKEESQDTDWTPYAAASEPMRVFIDPRTVPTEPEDPRVAVVAEWVNEVTKGNPTDDYRDLLARLDAVRADA